MKLLIKLVRHYIKLVELFSTRLAAKQVFIIFQRPTTRRMRVKELDFYRDQKKLEIKTEYGKVCYYESGDETRPLVVLVHGWESNAGSMSGIGEALYNRGFRVVSFDMPAHGQSEEKQANLYTMGQHMKAVLDHIKPNERFSVIGHSFGSLVSAYTLSQSLYKIDQLIYLTTPINLSSIFEEYHRIVGFSDKVYKGMVGLAEQVINRSIDSIRTHELTAFIDYYQLSLIHSRQDKVLQFGASESLSRSLPSAELIALDNVGHYRMLWDTKVIDHIMDKMSAKIS